MFKHPYFILVSSCPQVLFPERPLPPHVLWRNSPHPLHKTPQSMLCHRKLHGFVSFYLFMTCGKRCAKVENFWFCPAIQQWITLWTMWITASKTRFLYFLCLLLFHFSLSAFVRNFDCLIGNHLLFLPIFFPDDTAKNSSGKFAIYSAASFAYSPSNQIPPIRFVFFRPRKDIDAAVKMWYHYKLQMYCFLHLQQVSALLVWLRGRAAHS